MPCSFIPVICPACGSNLSRKSNADPTLVCTSCPAEYDIQRRKK